MRYQGRITEWNDDRGFGFITPGGGGERVFLHISAFSARKSRPQLNDRVSYSVIAGPKGSKASDVQMVDVALSSSRSRPTASKVKAGRPALPWRFWFLAALAIAAAGVWIKERNDHLDGVSASHLFQDQPNPSEQTLVNQSSFQCQGKTRCSEMTSCEEAQFYLRHCPGSVTDGDGDGLPCEDQWCGH